MGQQEKDTHKDSVNTVWWFSKSDEPKADVRNVLTPYSDRMRALLKDPKKSSTSRKRRPSWPQHIETFWCVEWWSDPIKSTANPKCRQQFSLPADMQTSRTRFAPWPFDFLPIYLDFSSENSLTSPGDLIVDIFSGSEIQLVMLLKGSSALAQHRDQPFLRSSVSSPFYGELGRGFNTAIMARLERGEHVILSPALLQNTPPPEPEKCRTKARSAH